jgi:hypothetical protein
MATEIRAFRILVKAKPGLATARLALGAQPIAFAVEPLFKSIGRGSARAAAPESAWQILTPDTSIDPARAWDVCHGLMHHGLGVAGVPAPELAEPDFQQSWPVGGEGRQALAAAGDCTVEEQDKRFPRQEDPLWYQDDRHAQFAAALQRVGTPPSNQRVRIAHLDTGYDPAHRTLPANLNKSLQRNFVDADRPNDASDGSSGALNNLGHGTGTLSILAGTALPPDTALGAAPFAEIVPIRVADRVVLFYNSAIARAFDYVHALCADPATRVHVVTMSMGGLASQAWADAINALYEAGVFVVTAAGNNFGNLPTRNIVYPARFNRVVAACGIMADQSAYADLGVTLMAGNYGPSRKMRTAVAAYTPNVPWAKLGCSGTVDRDGAGTSSATPQVAAAAALWIQRNLAAWQGYREGWMRVEAVRKALFVRAAKSNAEHFGNGALRARDALDEPPPAAESLEKEQADSASFAILRTLTGLGVEAAPGARQRMLELEALQLSQSASVESVLPDPDVEPGTLSADARHEIAAALAAHPRASQALRETLGVRPGPIPRLPPVKPGSPLEQLHLEHASNPRPPVPTRRLLKAYAFDPSLGTRYETYGINEAVLDIPWEDLEPGPVGEYVEVVDLDLAAGSAYAPVDLNHPHLLARSGLDPSEANPQFHQQMVYVVAMRTIEHFERALGRVALWAPRYDRDAPPGQRDTYVRRLRIYPHALRDENAYYSPERKALLLGYFTASESDSGSVLPGGYVFSALSHDIVAHETTHALLDGVHRRFQEATNPDVLAFHEAFADIVALFQHFTMPEALRQQIRRTRGDLGSESLLSQLAVQFGEATGRYGALRDFIGTIGENGTWVPRKPKRSDYQESDEPHARGAVLVAAIFAAFVQIYRARTADLIRLATGGTGVLPAGAISVDLGERLAREASKVAGQVLGMCIRALDYCPPIDLRFSDYLRALITADRDLVPDDPRGYRVAFVSAFRDRGIFPAEVRNLSVGTLIWEPPPLQLANIKNAIQRMSLGWDVRRARESAKDLSEKRQRAYQESRSNAVVMRDWLMDRSQVTDLEIEALGLSRAAGPMKIGSCPGELRPIEVHSVRPARRSSPDGEPHSDVVIEITQTFRPHDAAGVETGERFRGGCTLLVDRRTNEVRYCVRKRMTSAARMSEQQAFAAARRDPLHENYFDRSRTDAEPFAALHRHW